VHLLLLRPGIDEALVLKQEELAAVGEGGGVGRAPVVGAAQGANCTLRCWPGTRCRVRPSTSAAIA
jgi:hypothetical protein